MDKGFLIVQQSATDALKNTSKRAIKKTAEENGDLVRNKIAEKITKTAAERLPMRIQVNRLHK